MPAPDPKLTPWLRKNLRELTERGAPDRVELWHASEGSSSARLCMVNISEGVDVDELSQELWDTANQDSSTRAEGMPQRYLVALFLDDDQAPIGQFPFLVAGGGTTLSLSATEPPTDKGEKAQYMRHAETMHRMVIEQSSFTVGNLRNELESERRLRLGYEEKFMSVMENMQKLQDRQHERDMEMRREEAKAKRHEEFMGLLMSAAPILFAQFLGGAGLKGSALARDEGIKNFLKSLNEKEVNDIIGALEPAKQMLILELYKSYSEEDKSRSVGHPALSEAREMVKH